MSTSAPTLHKLQSAAKNCANVILTQQPREIEKAIELSLTALEQLVKLDPQFALLLLNSSDKKLSMMENIIIKQLLTVSLFGNRLNVLPKTIKTLNRTCLYLLYCLAPTLKQLKAGKLAAKQYYALKDKFINKAFKLGYYLKIEDKETIKLLSQLSGSNKFHSSNQLLQTLTLLAFNTNLLANLSLNSKLLTLEQSLHNQALLPPLSLWLGLNNKFLVNNLDVIQHLSSNELFSGNLIFCPNLGYFLAVSQSPDLDNWYCLPYDTETKQFGGEIVKITDYQITKVFPQVKLDHDDLWACYQKVKADWPIEDDLFSNKGYYDPITLKYSVPEFWPKATKALLTGNIKELSSAVDSRSEFRHILLDYASQANRNNLQITTSKHAISLLGLDRVFPVIATGMMKLVEESFRFTGSDELNNKVDYLADISLKLAEQQAKHSLPEYHVLLTRLLALSLFTIPKVSFSANNTNKKPLSLVFSKSKHLCLAEIYQYPRVELWLKVAIHMIDVWKLPKVLKQFVTKYLTSLRSNTSVDYSAIELEWLAIIEQTNLLFLLSFSPSLSKELAIKTAKAGQVYGFTFEQVKLQAQNTALELNVKTVLT